MKKIWICLLLMLFLVGCRDVPSEQAETNTTVPEVIELPKETYELKPIGDLSVIDDPEPVAPVTEVEGGSPVETETQNR